MSEHKITYLLGAGASAEALPTIKSTKNKETTSTLESNKGLPEALNQFLDDNYQQWSIKIVNQKNEEDDFLHVYDKLKLIAKSCIDFGTPDLYAKFLNAQVPFDNKSYSLLKLLLSNYFSLKQYSTTEGRLNGHGSLDKRTLTFLSTITEEGRIAKNVNIFSWNYDEQIEIAGRLINSREENFLPTWPNQKIDYQGDYFLVHLNGVAGWDYTHSATELLKENTTYKNFNLTRKPLLSFAWEKRENMDLDLFFDQRKLLLSKGMSDTSILVIIGYSFPFFNRKIDQELLKTLSPEAKIFYQDPEAHSKIPLMKNIFGLKNQIEPVTYTDQYFVPFEL